MHRNFFPLANRLECLGKDKRKCKLFYKMPFGFFAKVKPFLGSCQVEHAH